MGKWSLQQELLRERRELNKIRKENLCKFCYDLAKLTFAGVVIGGIIQLYGNLYDWNLWIKVSMGILGTYLIAYFANKILK